MITIQVYDFEITLILCSRSHLQHDDRFPVMRNTQRLLLNWKHHNSPWPRGLVSIIFGGGGGKFWLMFLNSPYSQLHGISVTNIFHIRPFFLFPDELSFIYLHDHLFAFTHYPYSSYFITITSLSILLETWIRAPAYIFWRTDPFFYHTCLTFALCCAQRH